MNLSTILLIVSPPAIPATETNIIVIINPMQLKMSGFAPDSVMLLGSALATRNMLVKLTMLTLVMISGCT